MMQFLIPPLKLFGLFILGLFIAFPIAAICDALSLLLSMLPIIWEIVWRMGLGLMALSVIVLFFEGLKA
jgi:hypothetical protein